MVREGPVVVFTLFVPAMTLIQVFISSVIIYTDLITLSIKQQVINK
jgi:hypothetical protein